MGAHLSAWLFVSVFASEALITDEPLTPSIAEKRQPSLPARA
jgi:hypothetical protein